MDESDAEQGLAHLLEHMAFDGSTHVANGEMIKILERHGLAFGADTNEMCIRDSAGAVASASGAVDTFSGAGGGGASASAIGNNLSVVTEGNNNTVIVNSVQSNTGNVTATTNVNGKP